MKKRLRTRAGQEPKVGREKGESPPKTSGVMRPDTGALRVPSDINDEGKSSSILPNKVVLVITLLALLFIAIIAWFVAHIPQKT
jgi:hypothetical protein